MTVLEPTPDRPRRSFLRRIAYMGTVAGLSATFALSLAGIATTKGTVSKDGEAAALAAEQRMERAHDCPRERWRHSDSPA